MGNDRVYQRVKILPILLPKYLPHNPGIAIPMGKVKKPRHLEGLYVHRLTYMCATDGCLPCLYKINPSSEWVLGADDVVRVPANQRPEVCPRSNDSTSSSCLYDQKHRILTVGK